ncbi:MAG: hypothetical protein AB7S26_33455 [Sandaracinaceae bacterium]
MGLRAIDRAFAGRATWIAGLAWLVVVAGLPSRADAQPDVAETSGEPDVDASHVLGDPSARRDPPALPADAPLTLRPGRDSRRFAEGVVRELAVRLDVPVSLGEDAVSEILEAVPAGHVGVLVDGERAQVVLAGPEAQVFRSNLTLSGTRAERIRAVALAIEALRDAAIEGPPTGRGGRRVTTIGDDQEVAWIYEGPRGGLFGELPRQEALAKPIVSLGVLGGMSTERLTPIIGPRLGLGLCLFDQCLLIEGDLPLVADTSVACDGRQIEYRAVTLSLVFQLRPITIDDWSFAFDFGVLSRFGLASLVGVESSQVTSNFGLRTAVETAWRFAGPMEMVLELGVDTHTSPAVLIRANRPPPDVTCPPIETILVEDLVTAWGVLAVRLRP